MLSQLAQLSLRPKILTYSNSLKINSNGGHLQGIQKKKFRDHEYIIVSGSSSSASYYAILKSGGANKVISYNKILHVPYKHAGGFQLSGNLLAIGVEDNELKNKSKVYVYAFENPEKPPAMPLKIIDREGPEKRATAGCVAILELEKEILLIVGDWDTKHLDFYSIESNRLQDASAHFELFQSIEIKTADKSSWIDEHWRSYQNINLVRDSNGALSIAAFASEREAEFLDLFSLEKTNDGAYKLMKTYTREFATSGVTRFRWGAGIYLDEDGSIQILACGENISEDCKIAVYE